MIYVNIDTIRPLDNIYGMIHILEELKYDFILFSNKKNPKLKYGYFDQKIKTSADTYSSLFNRKLFKSIVIGGGLKVSHIKLIDLFINNFVLKTVYFPPGLIDKPVGSLKYKRSLLNKSFYLLRKILLLFTGRHYILSTNKAFSDYYAKNNYIPVQSCLNVQLPKHLWMAKFLDVHEQRGVKYLLYAPTHDVGSRRNRTLDKIASGWEFPFDLRVSIHPQDHQKYDIPSSLIFNGKWNEVGAVITDHSSIGLDYAHVFERKHFRIDCELSDEMGFLKTKIFDLDVYLTKRLENIKTSDWTQNTSADFYDLSKWSILLRKLLND